MGLLFQAGRMAFRTIWQFRERYIGLYMARLDLVRLMIVTAVTGIFHVSAGMTSYTFDGSLITMIEREVVHTHHGRSPGIFGVAVLAFYAKETGMDVRLNMALYAQLRRTSEDFICMAFFTFQISVNPIEWEEIGMIEITQSVYTVMAIHTSRTELSLMFGHKSRFLSALRVAINTDIQIKLPDVALMAVFTDKLAAIIFLRMAGKAEPGRLCVIENLIVPTCRQPTRGGMAVCAVSIEHTLMNFGLLMTGHTLGGCVFESRFKNLIRAGLILCAYLSLALQLMALSTTQLNVFAIQRKISFGMIEIRHPVLTVVAIYTILPEILCMLDHEVRVMILMAGFAFGLIQIKFLVDRMASYAAHGRFFVINLMPEQAKPGRRVIKLA